MRTKESQTDQTTCSSRLQHSILYCTYASVSLLVYLFLTQLHLICTLLTFVDPNGTSMNIFWRIDRVFFLLFYNFNAYTSCQNEKKKLRVTALFDYQKTHSIYKNLVIHMPFGNLRHNSHIQDILSSVWTKSLIQVYWYWQYIGRLDWITDLYFALYLSAYIHISVLENVSK